MLARSTVETWVIKAEKDSPDCCPKCGGKVFEAEKMVTANGKWFHRNCFRCVTCNNMLDSLNNNDGPDGNLYCKMCYRHVLGGYSGPIDKINLIFIFSRFLKYEYRPRGCPGKSTDPRTDPRTLT